jgi:hypothetical protein
MEERLRGLGKAKGVGRRKKREREEVGRGAREVEGEEGKDPGVGTRGQRGKRLGKG